MGNYPVYVTVERSKSAIFHDWLRSVAGYAVIGVPAAIALVALSLLALRRTRREQQALARAATELSAEDRSELLRFAEFLQTRSPRSANRG